MNDVFRNSIFIQLITRFYQLFLQCWRQGVICRAYQRLCRAYRGSRAERIWLRIGAAPPAVGQSVYARVLAWLRRLLERGGQYFSESLCYRFLMAAKRLYLRLSANSWILRQVHRLSPKQWLLVAFGWYLPLEYVIREKIGIGVLSAVWEEAFLVLGVIVVLWRTALQRSTAIQRETPLDAFLLLFFAMGLLLMSLVQPYPAIAFAGYRVVVQYLLWFFIIIRLLETDKDFSVLWTSFVILVSALALHGIYQYLIGVEIPASWVSQTEMGVRTRVFSLTGSPNILGSLLTLLAPLCMAGVYYCRQNWKKLLCFALVCCILVALLFTFSRGAWLGIVLAVVIFSLFLDKRLLALMCSVVAAVLIFVPSITSRITYLFTQDYAVASAVGGRALRWETGKLLLTENDPLLGFGLGRFGGAVAMNNQVLDQTETFRYFYMDNYYLKILVEMGYVGLFAYLLLLAALVYVGIKAIQRSDLSFADQSGDALVRAVGNKRVLAIAIFSGLCGVLLHCYFENIFEEPYMAAYFWALAAMLCYLGFFQPGQAKADPVAQQTNTSIKGGSQS